MRGLVDVALSGAPLEIMPLLQLVCRIADRNPAAAEQVHWLAELLRCWGSGGGGIQCPMLAATMLPPRLCAWPQGLHSCCTAGSSVGVLAASDSAPLSAH